MKLAFSARADNDLEEIGDYIAQDSARRALSYIVDLRQWCETLTRFPRRYPEVAELGADLRRAAYGDYLVFYSIQPDQVMIERALHGARDIGRIHLP